MSLRWLLSGVLLLAPSFAAAQHQRCNCLELWWYSLWHGVPLGKQPCPDDYCRKPFPPTPPPVPCTGVNDYCRKPFPPCPPPVPSIGIDDYVPKPCPKVEPLCVYPPWYSCGQAGCPK